jgi:uncharacterized protein (TIGR02145 family)
MKRLFTVLSVMLLSAGVFAQSPQKMSYQCVVRNASGALVTNQAVGIKISILQGSASGTAVYTEILTPTTNANGLVSIEIGGGTGFDLINWSAGPYFLKTETDPAGGTNYTITGTSQILSVPYALFAKTAKTADYNDLTNKPLLFDGTWTSLTGKPLFTAVATSGSYNDLTNKPTLFDGTWTNITGKPTTLTGYGITDAMSISHTANSITSAMITNWNNAFGWGDHSGLYRPVSYVPSWSEITGKPASVDGFGITDAVTITGNQTITGIKTFSSDLLVNGLTVGRGKNAAIYSNTAFGNAALYYNTTGDGNTANGWYSLFYNTTGSGNSALGCQALQENSTGYNNTAIGYSALRYNTEGDYNTANGFCALFSNTTGNANTANGYNALYSNTTGIYNTANGYNALYSNTAGIYNTANGYNALHLNTTGQSNTATGSGALALNTFGLNNTANGSNALYYNEAGQDNTANGLRALYSNTAGSDNTAIGNYALNSNTTGNSNTAIGKDAGFSNTSGNRNIFIGNLAGRYETGSDKLFIDNQDRTNEATSRTKSLIYGVFNSDPANQVLTINGKVGIGTSTPGYSLEVAGNINFTGTLSQGGNPFTLSWANIADKPTTLTGYGIADAVNTSGNQTIAGNKTFTGTVIVPTPVNPSDAATKSYVDDLKQQVSALEDILVAAGLLTMTDNDGNTYSTVKIGDQIWIAENLKTTKYNDGTAIPFVTDNTEWYNLLTPGYCWYNNDIANKATYGALYNWYSVNTGKLCPTGWHVPTDAEWTTLINFLGGSNPAGAKLKETGNSHWTNFNGDATNESGFTARPGGDRYGDTSYPAYGGLFYNIGTLGFWWSSTPHSSDSGGNLTVGSTSTASYAIIVSSIRKFGYSVRCLKD